MKLRFERITSTVSLITYFELTSEKNYELAKKIIIKSFYGTFQFLVSTLKLCYIRIYALFPTAFHISQRSQPGDQHLLQCGPRSANQACALTRHLFSKPTNNQFRPSDLSLPFYDEKSNKWGSTHANVPFTSLSHTTLQLFQSRFAPCTRGTFLFALLDSPTLYVLKFDLSSLHITINKQ